jgi:hypothetical protein
MRRGRTKAALSSSHAPQPSRSRAHAQWRARRAIDSTAVRSSVAVRRRRNAKEPLAARTSSTPSPMGASRTGAARDEARNEAVARRATIRNHVGWLWIGDLARRTFAFRTSYAPDYERLAKRRYVAEMASAASESLHEGLYEITSNPILLVVPPSKTMVCTRRPTGLRNRSSRPGPYSASRIVIQLLSRISSARPQCATSSRKPSSRNARPSSTRLA